MHAQPRVVAALLLAALLGGCDPWIVEVGRGQVAPVLVERTMPTGLGSATRGDCSPLRIPYMTPDARSGEVTVAPLSRGCLLAMRQEAAILMSDDVMSYWADQLAGQDLSALVGVDMIVDELLVDGGLGYPIALEDVHAVSMHLDGRVLFDRDSMMSLEDEELRVPIPQDLVDRFIEALEGRRSLTAELEIRIVLRDGMPIPEIMHVRAVLQPVLLVDAWRYVF